MVRLDTLNRVMSMVDAAGASSYAYAAGRQLWTEDGPWADDTVTNTYNNRMRKGLSLAQPTNRWFRWMRNEMLYGHNFSNKVK